jgi:hypothetical protein
VQAPFPGILISVVSERLTELPPSRKAHAKLEIDPMFKTALITLATFATLALSAPPSETAAAEAALAGDVLRKAVSGKTVYLKISGFELPIRYSAGGSMRGSMSTVAAALTRGDGASDRGKWWISGDQLCQRWTSWMDGKSYCYKLTLTGKSVRWVRNDGRSGTARIGG